MKIIGLKNEKVGLLAYNPAWEKLYKEEEKLIIPIVEKYGVYVEHIGSTAIPGSKAKPIIDIAIGVRNLKDAERFVKPLKQFGYECKHDASIEKRYFFTKGNKTHTTHHLHVIKFNSRLWNDQIIFRDYLASIRMLLKSIASLKRSWLENIKTTGKSMWLEKINL